MPELCTQSDGGSRFGERMLTVSATRQQHERPLFPYLIAAVTVYWAHQPALKLLPAGGLERMWMQAVQQEALSAIERQQTRRLFIDLTGVPI